MPIHSPKTREQRLFLENVRRARLAGIATKTCDAVEVALLTGLNYCNFGHAIEILTDEYLSRCQDYLMDKAYNTLVDGDLIKWVGRPK
jgi:hypothetical protein